jgi:hypothetical protein
MSTKMLLPIMMMHDSKNDNGDDGGSNRYSDGVTDLLLQLNEHLVEVEDEAMAKTVELEKQLSEANTVLEDLKVK